MKELEVILSPGWSGLRQPKACILGLGLIGGSWAGALHRAGWEVSAVDSQRASLDEAMQRGWIKTGWTSVPQFLEVDLVVLALPLPKLAGTLDTLSGRLPKGALVTDVGSIKNEVCLRATLGDLGCKRDFYFVGGHPMSGSEQSGFRAADAELFRGYPYVLTPAPACPSKVVQALATLIQGFGAKVVFRRPGDHDMEVAMVSHIPHVLAVALTLAAQELGSEELSALELAGRSFREITRIADSSPEMWQEVLIRNANAVLEGLTLWEEKIKELKENLRQGEGEGIAEAFRQARIARRILN